jgi:hypothetical protein
LATKRPKTFFPFGLGSIAPIGAQKMRIGAEFITESFRGRNYEF